MKLIKHACTKCVNQDIIVHKKVVFSLKISGDWGKFPLRTSKVKPMLGYCCISATDNEPTLKQAWFDVSTLEGRVDLLFIHKYH